MCFFICPACTITVGVSLLFFSCCVSVCPWCICTDIYDAFIYASFSARMMAAMPCFPGTTLDRLRDNSCVRLVRCSTIICLNPKALHTSYIMIRLQKPPKKLFPPIHIPKALLKNSSRGLYTNIDSPGPSREYTGFQILLMLWV